MIEDLADDIYHQLVGKVQPQASSSSSPLMTSLYHAVLSTAKCRGTQTEGPILAVTAPCCTVLSYTLLYSTLLCSYCTIYHLLYTLYRKLYILYTILGSLVYSPGSLESLSLAPAAAAEDAFRPQDATAKRHLQEPPGWLRSESQTNGGPGYLVAV